MSFRLFALYRGMWRYTSVWDMWNIIKGNLIASLVLALFIFYKTNFNGISRSIFIVDFILCTVFISCSRLGIRMFFTHIKEFIRTKQSLKHIKNVILIGAGDTGQTIVRQALQSAKHPLNIVGFLDDNIKKHGTRLHNIEVLGAVEDLLSIDVHFDEIYICIPSANRNQIHAIVQKCKESGKPFKTLPSLNELIEGKISISQFRDVSLIDLLGREEVKLIKNQSILL
jgi:Predicted nucleoside-diphosphate sugar epimerases